MRWPSSTTFPRPRAYVSRDWWVNLCSSPRSGFHTKLLISVFFFSVGNEDYDWYVLENNAIYKKGYSSSDPTIRMFWEVFHELPLEDKKKFLLYLTGSDRIPIQGMKAIKVIHIFNYCIRYLWKEVPGPGSTPAVPHCGVWMCVGMYGVARRSL